MKTKKLLLTFAVLFIALISGCATDDFVETIGLCPVVESTIPTSGAIDVSLNQKISATFNEEMDPATFIVPATTSFTVETAGTTINGIVTYSGLVATFSPSTLLLANTEYTGRIKTTAKDLAGNALQEEYVWKFTTGVAPYVVSTNPAPLASNVPLNKTITAVFNTAMDPATLVDPATTFTLKDDLNNNIAGVVTYSGLTASFNPNALLLAGKTYTATISTAAKNEAGVPMAIAKVWSFTTGVTTSIPVGGSTLGVFGGSAGITNQGLFKN